MSEALHAARLAAAAQVELWRIRAQRACLIAAAVGELAKPFAVREGARTHWVSLIREAPPGYLEGEYTGPSSGYLLPPH
jgi:hypothetical protein